MSWETLGRRSVQGVLGRVRAAFDKNSLSVHHQEKKDVKQCMKVEECSQFRFSYYHCKKSQLDMRTRLKGNKGH